MFQERHQGQHQNLKPAERHPDGAIKIRVRRGRVGRPHELAVDLVRLGALRVELHDVREGPASRKVEEEPQMLADHRVQVPAVDIHDRRVLELLDDALEELREADYPRLQEVPLHRDDEVGDVWVLILALI